MKWACPECNTETNIEDPQSLRPYQRRCWLCGFEWDNFEETRHLEICVEESISVRENDGHETRTEIPVGGGYNDLLDALRASCSESAFETRKHLGYCCLIKGNADGLLWLAEELRKIAEGPPEDHQHIGGLTTTQPKFRGSEELLLYKLGDA